MASINRPAFIRVLPPQFFSLPRVKKVMQIALLFGASLVLFAVLLLTNGSLIPSLALLGLITVVLLTIYRVDWGFYVFILMVFFFEQYFKVGFLAEVGYFSNINGIHYIPQIKEAVLTPMELHLGLIFLVWVVVVALRKNIEIVPVPLRATASMFFLALISSVVYGLSRGGDLVNSLWETRAFFYLGIMFFFVPQIIRTREQLRNLIWFCIAGIGFKAFQAAERYASLGFTFGSWPHINEGLAGSDDAVCIVTLFLLLGALVVFGVSSKQRWTLLWLLPVWLLGFVAANRRSTYASFMATLFAFIILVPKRERQIILKILIVFLVVFGLYLAVFWNSPSRIGAIAQQFKSTVTGEGGIRGEYKDRTSTLYRDYENYNLAYTFRAAPAVGIGFGKEYDRPLLPWGSEFGLSNYIPHNQILWIFVKMGLIGGVLFWLFFNSFVFRGAMVISRLADPYLKAVCAVCVLAVIDVFVVAYVDMQLTFYRPMIYLGLLMGLVPVLERLDKVPISHSLSETPSYHSQKTI
jgi:hypothetical protein